MTKYEYVPTNHERENNPDCLGCVVETTVNEQRIWCPNAAAEHRSCQMKKNYRSVQITAMWHEQWNPSAGRVIGSKKQLEEHFKVQSDVYSERLNMDVNLQIADTNDTKTLGITEKGLDSTHDAKVRDGIRESKGKFVFPMKD